MAGDTLSLLWKVRADASGVKQGTAESRAAIKQLRTEFGGELNQMNAVAQKALGSVTTSLTNVAGRVPVVGSAVRGLTSDLEGTGVAAAGVAGSIGLMLAAVGAAVVGLTALGREVFDLTKQTAEFQGKFQDLSQQIGVTVETLSTLDVAASTTGGNIETVTGSLGIFQKNLEAAHEPTSKEAKLLKELGVTSLDTEVALRQVLRGLFALGPGAKQTDAVLQLFGRSGRFVNAILKETEGDLDKATEKFAKMGLIVSTESAVAADQFNDLMEIVSRQLTAVTHQLTTDAIPVFIVAFEDVSLALAGNKEAWRDWGHVVESTVAGVVASTKAAVAFIASRGQADFGTLFDAFFVDIIRRAQKLRNEIFTKSEIEKFGRITDQILGRAGTVGDRPDTTKAQSEAQARAAKSLALAQRAIEERTREHREKLERERDLDLKSIDEWESESRLLLTRHLEGQQEIFKQEEANINRFIKNEADRLLALTDLQQRRAKAVKDTLAAEQKLTDDANRRRAQVALQTEEHLFRLRETFRDAELKRVQDFQGQGLVGESAIFAQQLTNLRQAFEDRNAIRDLELEQDTISAERKRQLDQERIESEARFTSEKERLTRLRIEAGLRETAAEAPGAQGIPEKTGPIVVLPGEEAPEQPIQNLNDALNELGITMDRVFGIGSESGQAFANTIKSAVDDIAFAVGNLAEQWVLIGETGPAAMRRLTASVLAGLVRQAAIKAIYELAEGFAALFFNPAAAAAHFKAAALFGVVAGTAAIAGRGVAGDLFKPQASGAGAGAGNGSSQQLNPITLNRNQPQVQVVRHEHVLRIESNDSHIVKVVGRNWREGGEIRELIFNDAI